MTEGTMTEPVTEIDPRFSEPGAAPTPWADTISALAGAELFWLSTVRADGRPHVTPLVAVWLDGSLAFTTGEDEQKASNLRGNPNVVLTTGCNSWDGGLDVVVEGAAVAVTDQDALRRLADGWAQKWDGRWTWTIGDGCFHHEENPGTVLVFAVHPTKVLAFAKGTFSHTRHLF
jgi:general stress protein 26